MFPKNKTLRTILSPLFFKTNNLIIDLRKSQSTQLNYSPCSGPKCCYSICHPKSLTSFFHLGFPSRPFSANKILLLHITCKPGNNKIRPFFLTDENTQRLFHISAYLRLVSLIRFSGSYNLDERITLREFTKLFYDNR